MSLPSLIASVIVGGIVIGAWAYIAFKVWQHQELDREHLIDDVVWEPRREDSGRRP